MQEAAQLVAGAADRPEYDAQAGPAATAAHPAPDTEATHHALSEGAGKPAPAEASEVLMGRLTDRRAIRMALHIAIDSERALVDAYRIGYVNDAGVYVPNGIPPGDRETIAQFERNIAAFERVLNRYFGGRSPSLIEELKKGETISLADG